MYIYLYLNVRSYLSRFAELSSDFLYTLRASKGATYKNCIPIRKFHFKFDFFIHKFKGNGLKAKKLRN